MYKTYHRKLQTEQHENKQKIDSFILIKMVIMCLSSEIKFFVLEIKEVRIFDTHNSNLDQKKTTSIPKRI